jgi:hypothetical protein
MDFFLSIVLFDVSNYYTSCRHDVRSESCGNTLENDTSDPGPSRPPLDVGFNYDIFHIFHIIIERAERVAPRPPFPKPCANLPTVLGSLPLARWLRRPALWKSPGA